MLKPQDILVLVKLLSIQNRLRTSSNFSSAYSNDYSDFYLKRSLSHLLSVRGLAESIVIGKSEVSECKKRLVKVGLLVIHNQNFSQRLDLASLDWDIIKRGFLNLVIYSFQYFFFPAELKSMDFGIPTAFSKEGLNSSLAYSSPIPYIWPIQTYKSISGIAIEPMHKSIPYAAIEDEYLYEIFAIIDIFRIGSPREKHIAEKLFLEILGL
jgi:hypothetical protein